MKGRRSAQDNTTRKKITKGIRNANVREYRKFKSKRYFEEDKTDMNKGSEV